MIDHRLILYPFAEPVWSFPLGWPVAQALNPLRICEARRVRLGRRGRKPKLNKMLYQVEKGRSRLVTNTICEHYLTLEDVQVAAMTAPSRQMSLSRSPRVDADKAMIWSVAELLQVLVDTQLAAALLRFLPSSDLQY